MKKYVKTVALYVPLPFIVGAFIGWLYPTAGSETQSKMLDGIGGFANPYVFDLFAILSVVIVSLYVFTKGSITQSANRWEKALVYSPPSIALGFCVPYFAALYGFIIGHPPSEELKAVSILGLVGLIWSAGFLVMLLAPAHSGLYPRDETLKKKLYVIILFSTVVAVVWQHVT